MAYFILYFCDAKTIILLVFYHVNKIFFFHILWKSTGLSKSNVITSKSSLGYFFSEINNKIVCNKMYYYEQNTKMHLKSKQVYDEEKYKKKCNTIKAIKHTFKRSKLKLKAISRMQPGRTDENLAFCWKFWPGN